MIMTVKVKNIYRPVFSVLVLTILLAVLCAQATAQLVSLPKYDVSITVTPDPVGTGAQAHVVSYVTLLYYQMGKDPSVPGVYVEYELKGPSGSTQPLAISGTTDGKGYHSADFTVPSAAGEYTLVARVYDLAGGAVNGQNEARFTVKKGTGVVATPPAPTAEPVTPTPETPTVAPPVVTPKTGGGLNLGTNEILLIGGVIVILLILGLLVVAALAAFFLLRRRKKAVPAPAPVIAQAPAPEAPRRFCMHCGSPMAMEDAKCPKCGMTPPSGVDTKECPSCHTVIPEPAKFCHKCGVKQP
jgi:hypothetical protein